MEGKKFAGNHCGVKMRYFTKFLHSNRHFVAIVCFENNYILLENVIGFS